MKLMTNGSDANLYAVSSLMQGNTFGYLVACGSYVLGDSGPLQSWSASATILLRNLQMSYSG